MDCKKCAHLEISGNDRPAWFAVAVRPASLLILSVGFLVSCSDSFDFYDELGKSSVTDVSLVPASIALQVGESEDFEVSGGVLDYSFSIESGEGSLQRIDGYRVRYTAPGRPGFAVLLVQDRDGRTARSAVTVLEILSISPSNLVTIVGRTHDFLATGGLPPYVFSASGGSMESKSGTFTAPGEAGTVTITVRDNAKGEDHAVVTVYSELRILPEADTIRSRGVLDFDAEGGDGSYLFSVVSGGGAIDPSTGRYTAPFALFEDLRVIVQVADGFGQIATAALRVKSFF